MNRIDSHVNRNFLAAISSWQEREKTRNRGIKFRRVLPIFEEAPREASGRLVTKEDLDRKEPRREGIISGRTREGGGRVRDRAERKTADGRRVFTALASSGPELLDPISGIQKGGIGLEENGSWGDINEFLETGFAQLGVSGEIEYNIEMNDHKGEENREPWLGYSLSMTVNHSGEDYQKTIYEGDPQGSGFNKDWTQIKTSVLDLTGLSL